jgi:peroxidase
MTHGPQISRFQANPFDWTPSGNPGFRPGRPPGRPMPGHPSPHDGSTWPNPPGVAYRSFDGTGNRSGEDEFNVTGSDFIRLGQAHFSDGVSALRSDLPNARTISNLVVSGKGDTPNAEGLSAMMYAWGQFIDHDINLTLSDEVNHIDIEIPAGDPILTGSISLTRSVIDPLTGIAGAPALTTNHVTGWLDASMVYGSDASTAESLRGADGRLLTSPGNNLPIVDGAFAAGDIRVQENPDLTALQTLLLREHNRQVDQLALVHPVWTGDQLYDQARAVVSAEIARITYREFLPHLLGAQAPRPYSGFKPSVNPTMSEEFAGAAFRFGHSIVSAKLEKVDEQGAAMGESYSLRDAFFQDPSDFIANGGADGLLRHLGSDLSNALDVHIVDDLRNFLFGPSAGMDLAAINIQRGRDLGLGTLNETRLALGLKPYRNFAEVSLDPEVVASLKKAYGEINKLELWIGGLAENHMRGAMVGQTFAAIIGKQFEALRDGDRQWYLNQGFDPSTIQAIESTTLSSLILNNTDTETIQPDAFIYYERRGGRHSGAVMQDASSHQLVVGSDGFDILTGGKKGDLLIAGSGRQRLIGGQGPDVFRFGHVGTVAEIKDFSVGLDRIEFERLSQPPGTPVSMLNEKGHVAILFGDERVSLPGVSARQFHAYDVSLI